MLNSFLFRPVNTYITSSGSLGNGVDSKQTRVRVARIESADLFRKKKEKSFKGLVAILIWHTLNKTMLCILTSNGSAVALATPWTSLLVAHEPLFTCGPAPSTCCRTLKARASLEPAAADSATTAEWTKLLVPARRISPGERQNGDEKGWAPAYLLSKNVLKLHQTFKRSEINMKRFQFS